MFRSLLLIASCGVLATCAAVLAGCGGAVSVAEARPAFSASTKLGIQPNTLEPAEAGTALIRSNVAVQGAVLYAGINDSNQTAVWAGSETFPFYGALDDPVLDCANLDYAIGSYSGLGSNHYTCFIWPYRTNGSITPLPNCVLLSESKTGDLFFDQEQPNNQQTSTVYMLSLHGNSVSRVPYKIPAVKFLSPLNWAMVNKSGLALIELPESGLADRKDPNAEIAMRVRMRSSTSPLRRASAGMPIRPASTESTSNVNGYYLISTTADPVELQLPASAYFGIPMALGDQGITVGYVYFTSTTSNDGFIDKPYYWDRRGKPHEMPLPANASQGLVWDINSKGEAAGDIVTNDSIDGVVWPTINSVPFDVNLLLPANDPYHFSNIQSIGEDDSLSAICTPKPNNYPLYYIGLQPALRSGL